MKTRLRLPSTLVVSVLAALTTWLTLTTWSGFSEDPGAYLRPLALGCAIVALTGALLRSARLHPVLVVVGQVAVVMIWLNHRFAPDPSILGWLPTGQSVRDWFDLLSASSDAANSYPSPVPVSIIVFPAILIAVGSLLAVLVDLLACGARRVPLAGLPLLAMYTAPVSILETGVPWWKFALIASTFLLLLAGEEATRLAHWGRDLGSTGEHRWTRTTNQTVWPSARKIGVTATAVAVVVPLFIPTFAGGILGGGGGAGGSGNGVRIDNPMLNMRRDLVRGEDIQWLQVTTDDPNPEYIRIAVLDEYDGSAWIPKKREIPVEQRVDQGLPEPEGLTDDDVAFTAYEYEFVADEDFDSSWLPIQFPALSVDVDGDWRYDVSTMDIVSAADGEDIGGQGYSAVGLDVEPTADNLRDSQGTPTELFLRYTEVDSDVPDFVEDLAKRVTDAGANRAERAALLQDWFAKPHEDSSTDPNFEYNLAATDRGSSVDALTDFLNNSRTGYCEQFAGAMALMARTIQIPARVAVGFLKPDSAGGDDSNTWIFSSHDLHAWPELYFDGVGWVRFEPTPGARPGASSPPFTDDLQPITGPSGGPTTATSTTSPSAPTTSASPRDNLPDEVPFTPGSADSGRPWQLVVLVIAVPLLLVVAAAPMLARRLVRRRRWAAAVSPAEEAEAAWAELRDSMIDLRLPWDDQVTVRQRAKEIVPLFRRHPGPGEEHLARVITSSPDAEAALGRISLLVERARYARSVPDLSDVRRDVELCVASLRIGVEKNVRRRALLLPASLLKRSRRVTRGESGLAALDEPSMTP